jgi:FMN phosphatase YigB (HAD superfamily)
MLEQKYILTDADGVLLDWEVDFNKWMTAKGYTKRVSDVYAMETAYDIDRAESKALVRQFNSCAWMGYLPVFRDAKSGVAKLVEMGYKFICITSLSLDENAAKLRMSNLENIFGKGVFEELICLDTGADKDEVLEKYKDTGMYWIEDKVQNANLGDTLGLKSILIDHGHNLDSKLNNGVVRVGKWAHIVDIIAKD